MQVLYRTFPLAKNSRGYTLFKVTQSANVSKNVSVSASQRLGLVSDPKLEGLGLVSDWKSNVSVSDPKVSFTSL